MYFTSRWHYYEIFSNVIIIMHVCFEYIKLPDMTISTQQYKTVIKSQSELQHSTNEF